GNFARRFAFDRAFFQVGAFIARDPTLADTDLGFEFSVLPIEFQHNKRATFDLTLAVKFVDLLVMQEKFADTFCARDFVTRFFVWLYVGVVEKRFVVLDSRERVTNVGFAGADGLDLAAFELDAGLVALENVKIAQRLAIKDRLGGHDRA